jgi:hypothetical protein
MFHTKTYIVFEPFAVGKDDSMTNPFDRFTDLAGANRALMTKLIEIMRANGAQQVDIGTKMLASIAEGAKDQKMLPSPLTECFREIERTRQTAVKETKSAFDTWRKQTEDAFPPEAGQAQISDFIQNWSSLLLAPFETPAKAKASKPPAKATKQPDDALTKA